MIPYADFEFAIKRWKARAAGNTEPVAPSPSGAVEELMPDSSEGQGQVEALALSADTVVLEE
jgi:hypothetical protein